MAFSKDAALRKSCRKGSGAPAPTHSDFVVLTHIVTPFGNSSYLVGWICSRPRLKGVGTKQKRSQQEAEPNINQSNDMAAPCDHATMNL